MVAEMGAWKPVLTALALPPVPWMLLLAWSAWRWARGHIGGAVGVTLALVLWWLSACEGTAIWLQDHVLKVPAPLSVSQRETLRQQVVADQRAAPRRPSVAVIVLGGGLEPMAEEYGMPSLGAMSLVRLRYGTWLARDLGAPLGMSGGVGWAQKGLPGNAAEADIGAGIAQQEWGMRLRWVESGSADTRGNAKASVDLLATEGVQVVVLVSSAYHLPRAQRVFEQAAQRWAASHPGTTPLRIVPAGTAYWHHDTRGVLQWLPSAQGMGLVHTACRELLGLWVGA